MVGKFVTDLQRKSGYKTIANFATTRVSVVKSIRHHIFTNGLVPVTNPVASIFCKRKPILFTIAFVFAESGFSTSGSTQALGK